MNIDDFILRNFYNDDVIYHYTTASTAIDHILSEKRLKFRHIRKSNDPVECRYPECAVSGNGAYVNYEKNLKDCNYLRDLIMDLDSRFYQICFCKNIEDKKSNINNNHCPIIENEKFFGFAKPTMWEQYTDDYTGVCIAFSKKKILALNKDNTALMAKDILYLTNLELRDKRVWYINYDYLSKVGPERYRKEIENKIKTGFFCKHKECEDENEFRIGMFFNNQRIPEIDKEDADKNLIWLKTEGCIKALFVSSLANDKQKKDLLKYANKLNVPIIEIAWTYNSFGIRDFKSLSRVSA